MYTSMITKGAATAIADMLDNCCQVKAKDEVLIVAHVDGLQGGDNLVDEQTIAWIQEGVIARGANPSVLWIDETAVKNKWRVPPILLGAMRNADVCILHSFDLTTEEMRMVHENAREYNVRLCRNFASTVGLLNTPWAQTPHELVNAIRYEAAVPFDKGIRPYVLEDALGTHIEGRILPPNVSIFPSYAGYRIGTKSYRPFPEWVFPPINIDRTNGVVVFDRMLSWWSRYIGISPYFGKPVELEIRDSKIVKISGGEEADKIKAYVEEAAEKIGDAAYNFPEIHGGVHPCTYVGPQNCSNPLVTRIIDHSSIYNVHFHIGAPFPSKESPYWPHITGDLQKVTWTVGDDIIYKDGYLMALDSLHVKEVAAKYPGRPGTGFVPKSY